MTLLPIKSIHLDGGTQSRAELNESVIADYAEAMGNGTMFPDVTVFFDGADYWLGDGFHRVHGAARANLSHINADVRQGTRRDAVLFSVGANHAHGLRRTNDDKRRAVTTLLLDEQWAQWSDREIARRCGVDHKTVGAVRAQLQATGEIPQSDQRAGADGRTTNTANIGASHSARTAATPAHWSRTWSGEFWRRVNELGLDAGAILRRIQPHADALADLTVTREKAFEELHRLAVADLRERFPLDSCVLHVMTKRVGQVKGYDARSLNVFDLKQERLDQWMATGLRPATEQDKKAYLKVEHKSEVSQLRVGDRVRTRTGRETTVTAINGRIVHVEGDTRHHYPDTLTKLNAAAEEEETAERVPEPQEPAPKPGTGEAIKLELAQQGLRDVFRVVKHKDGAYTAAFDNHIRHSNNSANASARGYAERIALAGYHVESAGVDIDMTLGFSGDPKPMVRFRVSEVFDDNDEWCTPADVIALARELMGDIDLDPASNDLAQRVVQASSYHTRISDGLIHNWRGRVWLNPPYSYPQVERFTQKLIQEYERGNVTQATVLVNNRADADWCQQLMFAATATCFSAKRIGFEHPRLGKPDQNRQGQIFFYFGEQPLRFARLFGHFGAMFGQAIDGTQLRKVEAEEAVR